MDLLRVFDNSQALESFQKTIGYESNQYFVTWPWKE